MHRDFGLQIDHPYQLEVGSGDGSPALELGCSRRPLHSLALRVVAPTESRKVNEEEPADRGGKVCTGRPCIYGCRRVTCAVDARLACEAMSKVREDGGAREPRECTRRGKYGPFDQKFSRPEGSCDVLKSEGATAWAEKANSCCDSQ